MATVTVDEQKFIEPASDFRGHGREKFSISRTLDFFRSGDTVTLLGFQIDRCTCSTVIKHLRSSSSSRDRRRTFELMEKIDVCEDSILFSTIVDACARLKDQRGLQHTIEKFHRGGLRPNVHTYGTLIKAYGRCNNVEKAWELWKEMTELRGLEPTSYVHGCMFDTLVSNGRVEEGISLLKQSLETGKEANTVQYSILIKGCAQKKQVDEALALYYDMQSRNIPCNEVTYNTLINACASAGDLVRAEIIMGNMRASINCKPDVITYSTMIKGFCSKGQAERAFQLFREMEADNIKPDAIVFNILLEGCSKRMQVGTAEEVFNRMLKQGVSPSSFTLTILIKLYGKTNNLHKALELAEKVPLQFGFDADAYVYTALIAACLTNGEVNKALEIFEAMNVGETRNFVTGRTFGTVIIGCIKSCRYFKAYELLLEAHRRHLEVDHAIIQRLQQSFIGKQEKLTKLYSIHTSHIILLTKWLSEKMHNNGGVSGPPPELPQFVRKMINQIEYGFRYQKHLPSFVQPTQRCHIEAQYNTNHASPLVPRHEHEVATSSLRANDIKDHQLVEFNSNVMSHQPYYHEEGRVQQPCALSRCSQRSLLRQAHFAERPKPPFTQPLWFDGASRPCEFQNSYSLNISYRNPHVSSNQLVGRHCDRNPYHCNSLNHPIAISNAAPLTDHYRWNVSSTSQPSDLSGNSFPNSHS